MSNDAPTSPIDPADLQTCIAVLQKAGQLPDNHPDALVLQRATAQLYKRVKRRNRDARRERISAHDAAVTARTATGAPGRIDDETRGIPLVSNARGAVAGTLQQPRGCYVCKRRYTQVDAFYHQLCPDCAVENHARRDARTDLTGRRALLTGGRAKIGMYIALRLLRDGAETTITTRFPKDAARRFSAMEDAVDWLHRLHIVGIDLRDPAQVIALADSVAASGPLDILINNAAQTVRRAPGSYAQLIAAEREPLDLAEHPAASTPDITTFGRAVVDDIPAALGAGVEQYWAPTPHGLAELAQQARSADFNRIATGTAIDAGGLVPDLADTNSWVQVVDEVDPAELLEVQLCNQTAPFILISRLRAALAASPARRTYIVNVSVDGAARVYDPIVRGEAGEDLHGCFLKDYRVADW